MLCYQCIIDRVNYYANLIQILILQTDIELYIVMTLAMLLVHY